MWKSFFAIVLTLPLLLCAEETTYGYLGVGIENLNDAMKTALDLEHGVIVNKVFEESPAEEGGIEVGDVIMKIDDDEISDYGDLRTAVREKPNERVSMRIHRSGKTLTKYIEIGEKEHKKIELDVEIPDIEELEIEIPDIEELEDIIIIKKGELEEELEQLKEELEELKVELEKMKENIKK
jgi:C-terminal processing protease CtpA/Prc